MPELISYEEDAREAIRSVVILAQGHGAIPDVTAAQAEGIHLESPASPFSVSGDHLTKYGLKQAGAEMP